MWKETPKKADPRSGQMVIFVTLSLFFLFSVMGLAVDLGYAYSVKVSAQGAADAAATAAARYATVNGYACTTGITCNSTYTCPSTQGTVTAGTVTSAFQAGCAYAATNGFLSAGSQTVTLIANNTAPPNSSGVTTSLWVQANVAQTVPHLFLFWAGFQNGSVGTQAIAGVTSSGGSGCVYVLNPSAPGALTISGASTLTGSGCGVYVNSTATAASGGAISMSGSASITATGGAGIQIRSPGAVAGNNPWDPISPNPTAVASVDNPLSGLTLPSNINNSCDYPSGYTIGSSSTGTINPGIYCGGITIGGSAHLTMNQGTYIIRGGGFNSGNSGVVNASGVTIIFTGTGGTGMQLSGATVDNMSAPTSGSLEGILFYQDPAFTYAGANNYGNSAHLNATGTLYFPTTALNLSGAISASKMALVVSTLNVSGSATFNQDVSGSFTGLVRSSAWLIQ